MPFSIQDAQIAHSIQVIKAANGMAKGIDAHIKVIADHIRQLLSSHDVISTKKLLNEITKNIDAVVLEELTKYTDQLQSDLTEMVGVESGFNQQILTKGTTATAITAPTKDAVMKVFNAIPLVLNNQAITADDYLANFTANQRKKIKSFIVSGWANSKTTAEISREIIGTSTMRGALDVTRSDAFRMAKDLSSHLSTTSKTAFGAANDDIIIGEEQISTLDSKTSSICQISDHKKYYYKDGKNFPRPPLHMNCRSTMIFIIHPDYVIDADSTRPSVSDGEVEQVDAKEDYVTWIKRQPYDVQVEALGAKRALLINNMSAEEFKKSAYNNLGEYITLDEMSSRSKTVADLLGESSSATQAPKVLSLYDARREVEDRFGSVTINIKDKSEAIATDVLNTFNNLADEYDISVGDQGLTSIIISNKRQNKTVSAGTRGSVGFIGQERRSYFINTAKAPALNSYRYNVEIDGIPEAVSTATHEFGHLIYVPDWDSNLPIHQGMKDLLKGKVYSEYAEKGADFSAAMKIKDKEALLDIRKRASAGEFKTNAKANAEYHNAISQNRKTYLAEHNQDNWFVSEYALTSIDELVAEAFADYKLSDNPATISIEIGKLIDKYTRRE